MNVKDVYEKIGGDYEEVYSRFRGDERVKKFALKFLNDKSFDLLCESLESGNYEEAFRASHTIKGICSNLAFTRLYQSSCELTELLREGQHDNLDDYVDKVRKDYMLTVEGIRKLAG